MASRTPGPRDPQPSLQLAGWLPLVTFPFQDPVTVVVDDLRLCTVKLCPDSERRFCFEVVSPSK